MTQTTVATTGLDVPPSTGDESVATPRADRLRGTGMLLRLLLRRDRTRLVLWTAGIVGLVAVSAASITGLYTTQQQLENYARTVQGNSALIVQAGPGYGLDDPTIGAVTMNETALWTFIAAALMSIFMVVRHTRTEEESERAELVRAAPVGRHAALVAAMMGAAVANAVVAVGLVASLVAYGMAFTGSVAFGLSSFGAGMVFAGIAAVAAQVASGSRAALGMGGIAIGVSFALRAIGDVGNGVLSWASPLGWAQAIRAFADERWWVLVLPVVTVVLLSWLAVALQARRDFGAGLVPQRPGAAAGGDHLATPIDLAVRLQRGALIGWTVGIGVLAFFYGIVADQAEQILEDNPEMEDFFAQLGQGSITDVFLATSVLIMALMASGFTVSSILRLRSEEVALRADPVLVAPVSRRRWARSHLTVTVVGTTVVMLVIGLSVGLGYGLVVGDIGQTVRLAAAGLVMVPALLVLAGAGLALHGLGSRWSPLTWGLVAWVAVAGLLGGVLDLPQWAMNLSPFEHVPGLPADSVSWLPLVALLVVAAALMALGFALLDRRDIAT